MYNDYLGSKRRTALIFPYFDLNNKWDSQKSCLYLQSPSRSHSLIGNFNPSVLGILYTDFCSGLNTLDNPFWNKFK